MLPEHKRLVALRSAGITALLLIAVFVSQLPVAAAIPRLPPRPTPAVTPYPTPTLRPASRTHAAPVVEPISHIALVTTPAADGLWTVVQWQGQDGAWHDVAGWRGTLVGGAKRWAVLERNFGEGPFRWVVYDGPDRALRGTSQAFYLPAAGGAQLLVRVVLDP